nr:reverse transcriptase domain-containing protein [Tanacetum cinerariifolium]
MEEDYKLAVQHQRRVNPKIHEAINKEVEKFHDAGLIYPISDSPWVSSVHCVPKKGGFIVVENEENELIPTLLVTGWRGTNTIVSSMVSSGIFKFPLTLVIRRKLRLPAHTERLPIVACLSVCAMHRACFKGDFLDCEVSGALSFCPSFTRALHPQLHFGNPNIQILSTNVFLLAYFINGLTIT